MDDETEEVDLLELLKECAQTVCKRYRVDPAVVSVQGEPCVVQNRRVDLMVVFRNLIDNAVKYAGNPPEVQIVSTASEDQVQVQICDNGRGVPKKERNRIFGRFVRLGLELERDKPGTGLGLSIVRTLVRRMRGRITVSDREDGPGTTFAVAFPKALPTRAAKARLQESTA